MRMRTLGRTKLFTLGITLALCACGEVEKAMDKLEEMDKEMAGEEPEATPTVAAPSAPAPAAPAPAPAVPAPAPAPAPAPEAAPAAVPEVAAKPTPSTSTSTSTKTTTTTKTTTATTTKPETVKPEPVAKPEPAAPKPEPAKPEPVAAKPEPAPSKVSIPQSKHVQVSAPKRVQELLDADPRMQPWLNNTMKVIEQCYADLHKENASSAGTIVFQLEMHKNARPDADITSLPASLSGVVACATGKLMRAARMPLFTGDEGEKHTVRVKFTP